jgi:hypothetical protein
VTTLDELVGATPAATRGVPAGFVHGTGVWRHVVEIADPGLGAAVVWHDLTAVEGAFTGYDYTRGSDGYQGRYRASVVELDLYCSTDALAPWNTDNSDTFGTHIDLGPGLLIRSGFIRVAGGVVNSWNPRWTCKVEAWGDASHAAGKVRRHRVTARDTMSSLVGVPLSARPEENWFDRLVWTIANSGWPYGWFAYGARTTSAAAPILLLPERPASSSAINELDATLDPVGLQWYTDRQGRLIVRPRVNDTFHAAAFLAGAIGDPYPDRSPVEFAWWACMGDPPADGHAAYAVDTPGVDPFGFDGTDRWVVNHVKVTDPTGPGFDDDDPVSIGRYDRKTQQMQWQAPNDVVAADLLALRADATVEARPLHTNIALANFHPGPATAEFLDYVTILHRNTDAGHEAFGNGWLRSYTEQVRPLGCDTDWSLQLTVDIYNISAAATSLLPVEDLTLEDVTDTQATFSWTNPTQVVTPTHTQIRLINPASLWQTVEYPLDGLIWSGLVPETGYEFQVRLIRRVDGVTTHYSPIRALNFTTLEATVPIVDDGDVILPPPDDGCEVFWELVSSPDGTDPWTVEDSGTITEPPYELPDYDMSLLDPDVWYRFQSREICSGVPGSLDVGDVFVVECIARDVASTPPYDDDNLVAYWPELCPNNEISELVSGEEMIQGHALTRVDVIDEIPVMVTSGAGLVGYQIIGSPVGSNDLSIGCRVMIGNPPATETTVFEYGGAWISIVKDAAAPDPDAAGFTVNGYIQRAAGVINVIHGTTIFGLDDVYDLLLTHDPGTGDLILYVDGVVEVADVVAFGDRVAFGPVLYHTMDDLTGGAYANHGSLAAPNGAMKDFNTASGAAANLPMEEEAPFTLCCRLVSANGECLTTHGNAAAAGYGNQTTYSVFAKLASGIPLPAAMALSANGNNPTGFASREHLFAIQTNGAMSLNMFNGGTQTTFTTAAAVIPNDGAWHMLTCTFAASTAVRFYVDGVQVFAQTTGIPAAKNNPATNQKPWGGHSSSATGANMSQPPLFPFNGWLAHCFIENTALSAATILGIWEAVFPP